MFSTCSEIVQLQHIISELHFSPPLHADHTSAIRIIANLGFHERTKHNKVDCHSVKEAYDDHSITLEQVSTDLQIADIFIKALTRI